MHKYGKYSAQVIQVIALQTSVILTEKTALSKGEFVGRKVRTPSNKYRLTACRSNARGANSDAPWRKLMGEPYLKLVGSIR